MYRATFIKRENANGVRGVAPGDVRTGSRAMSIRPLQVSLSDQSHSTAAPCHHTVGLRHPQEGTVLLSNSIPKLAK